MKSLIRDEFGRDRLLIGMVHTMALPGSPLYDRAGSMRKIIAQARDEAKTLEEAGFHAVMYCNESDMPYQSIMPAEAVAAMTDIVSECQAAISLVHGVNMLIDPAASIAIAHATGGRFVRAILTGALAGDIGMVASDGARALRLRANIGAENIRIIANVTASFSTSLDTRPVEEQALGAVFIGLADMVCVSGAAAGREADISMVKRVARHLPSTPVAVGTGVAASNIGELSRFADAFIIGTSIKQEGKTLNPIDPVRARALVKAFESREQA